MKIFYAPHPRSRRGIGLIEVIICVGCLALILLLVLPWLLTAREASREQICLDRCKKITDAVMAYADSNSGDVPYLVDEVGWPVAVLPYLDVPGAVRDGKRMEELKTLSVPMFVCPVDPRLNDKSGALSYVLNAGYGLFPVDADTQAVSETGTHSADIDLNGDGEVTAREWDINYATGIIWRPDTRPDREGFHMSLTWISTGDGLAYTLLLSENLNGGAWISKETMDLAFVIGRERLQFPDGADGEFPLKLGSADLGPFAVNGNLGTLGGHCPGPSSLHGEYAHAMYGDGHGGPMSARIDPLAYARLMTSNGAKYGQGNNAPLPNHDSK